MNFHALSLTDASLAQVEVTAAATTAKAKKTLMIVGSTNSSVGTLLRNSNIRIYECFPTFRSAFGGVQRRSELTFVCLEVDSVLDCLLLSDKSVRICNCDRLRMRYFAILAQYCGLYGHLFHLHIFFILGT